MFASRIIGHRGCAAHAPENTLAGLREGTKRGATWVEIDVCLLGDGTPIIIHDDKVDRTTNGTGALKDLDWGYVSGLDAGGWFDPKKFAGERVPRLDDALAEVQSLGLGLNLELKIHGDEGARLVQTILPYLYDSGIALDQLLVSSFDHVALGAFHAAAPGFAIGMLYSEIAPDWHATADALDAVAIVANYSKVSEAAIRGVIADGRDIYVYTPNDPKNVFAQWRWGLDGVITDDPERFR
jgi:glycerophosphoryl diester phosphodiesterase